MSCWIASPLSTLAYQCYGGGMSPAERKRWLPVLTAAEGGVAPDIVFVLDLPAKEAMARVTRRDGAAKTAYEKRGVAWLERVRKGFLAAAKEQEAARKAGRRTRYVVLDARQSQGALRDEVRRVVSRKLGL